MTDCLDTYDDRVLKAHPLTDVYALPVPPLVLALTAGFVVLAVALALPRSRRLEPEAPPVDAQRSRLTRGQVAGRVVAVAALLLAIAAGRLGPEDQLDNAAPALVVGLAWPLLFLVAALWGRMWCHVDPWDALARLLGPREGGGPDTAEPESVWPAVALVLPWLWYLGAYRGTLEPRSVGLVLAVYTLVTVTGCLAFGRRRWLETAEPLGILLRWTGLLPRRLLATWRPPQGAEVLIGVVLGGLLFAVLRRSELWGSLNTVSEADLVAAAGLLACCLVGAGIIVGARALSVRADDRVIVTRAVVPLVPAVVLAVGLERNRLTTSAQLLPGLLGDPFGRGWNLIPETPLDPSPLGVAGLIALQVALVVVGGLAGVWATRRSRDRTARLPAALGVAVLADAAVLLLSVH